MNKTRHIIISSVLLITLGLWGCGSSSQLEEEVASAEAEDNSNSSSSSRSVTIGDVGLTLNSTLEIEWTVSGSDVDYSELFYKRPGETVFSTLSVPTASSLSTDTVFTGGFGDYLLKIRTTFTDLETAVSDDYSYTFYKYKNISLEIDSADGASDTLDNPDDIEIDSTGNIYISDMSNDRVLKYDSSGDFVKEYKLDDLGMTDFNNPGGLCQSSNGILAVIDINNDRVVLIDPNNFTTTNASAAVTLNTSSFSGSYSDYYLVDCVFDDTYDDLFISDTTNEVIYRVQFEDNNDWVVDSSSEFITGVSGVWGIDYFNGYLYTVDKSSSIVSVYNVASLAQATLISSGTGTEAALSDPRFITVDAGGDIYLTDIGTDQVMLFGPTGNYQQSFGINGSDAGEFKDPKGIAVTVDSNGDAEKVYVVDQSNDRLQIFE